jgi:hypothetical protein
MDVDHSLDHREAGTRTLFVKRTTSALAVMPPVIRVMAEPQRLSGFRPRDVVQMRLTKFDGRTWKSATITRHFSRTEL